MAEGKPTDTPRGTAAPTEAAEPVELPQIMGATFAERKAAREKADKKADKKAVKGDDAEDKSVGSAESKTQTRKK